jgi:hypothetical protein
MAGKIRRSGQYVEYDERVKFMREVIFNPTTYTADGQVTKDVSFVVLNGASTGVDVTIDSPTAGRWLVVTCSDSTNDCTARLVAGTFDGTNNKATFPDAADTLVLFGVSSTRFVIVENIGGVTLSAV